MCCSNCWKDQSDAPTLLISVSVMSGPVTPPCGRYWHWRVGRVSVGRSENTSPVLCTDVMCLHTENDGGGSDLTLQQLVFTQKQTHGTRLCPRSWRKKLHLTLILLMQFVFHSQLVPVTFHSTCPALWRQDAGTLSVYSHAPVHPQLPLRSEGLTRFKSTLSLLELACWPAISSRNTTLCLERRQWVPLAFNQPTGPKT